ncbi:DUF433 domain-containing protein [Tianweitania sediminis]|uniref:DUF433 domain-containing protein n=1 Tax=Tianweitania sediminis TaxID=1502156 RepID=A0A8J7R4C5_9HYPH|nr:DUF433 domain-containing protein [Tianweitania sediminis]MBP0440476.1 DUF433 domain-containing protein [Tianweitania sediminis]
MAGINTEVLTANEAASVTRVPLKQVHRIIDAGLLRGRVEMRRGSRVIVGTGLVGLRLAWLTADMLTPMARRRIVERAIATDAASVVAADPLKIDLKPIAAEVKIGLTRLRKAKAMVTCDADVHGGHPVFAGTRVPVHDVADMLANGDAVEAIHSAYPQLTFDQIGLAADYVVAYPRRGRPPVKPVWRAAPAKSSRTVDVDDLPAAS